MRTILVIGIGAGDPDQLTVQAVKALNRADVFFVLDKGAAKEDLVRQRREILDRHVDGPRGGGAGYRIVEVRDPERDRAPADYAAVVRDWHERRAELFERAILDELPEDGCGAFLVWGDPSLYDSTLRIIDRILERGAVMFDYQVIPGITSVQALAASHRLTLNRIGRPVGITTGRRLADGFPPGLDDVVVMLDADNSFLTLPDPDDLDIYWGAYLGTADEILVRGRVSEVGQYIERTRAEARARKGWIMDIYLLRRSPPTPRADATPADRP